MSVGVFDLTGSDPSIITTSLQWQHERLGICLLRRIVAECHLMTQSTAARWKQGFTWAIAIIFSGLGGAVLNNVLASRSTTVEYSINRTALGADQTTVIPEFKVGGLSLQSLYIYNVKLQYSAGPELENAKVGIDLGTLNVKPIGKIVPDGPTPLFAVTCEPFVPGAKSISTICSIGRLSSNVGTYTVSFATDTDVKISLSIDARNTQLRQAGTPETAKTNFWAISWLLALLGTVAGYLFGRSSGRIADLSDAVARGNQPILELDYEGTEGNRVEAHYKNKDQTDIDDIYIRVRVRNVGQRTATGARVFLTGLQEVQNSNRTRTCVYDSLPLPWAGWTFESREIPAGVSYYADLMRVSKHTAGWLFSAKMFASHAGLARYSGTYRFQVKVTADNAATAVCEVDVTYKQDWHTLSAVAVPKAAVSQASNGPNS